MRCRGPSARLDVPLAAGQGGGSRGSPGGVEAGDSVDNLLAEEEGPVAVVAVAAYPGGTRDLREVDPGVVGAPDRPADDTAVGPVQLRVVWCAACAAGLDGVEGGPLEGRRVPLDESR
jgi:hypothetical protein